MRDRTQAWERPMRLHSLAGVRPSSRDMSRSMARTSSATVRSERLTFSLSMASMTSAGLMGRTTAGTSLTPALRPAAWRRCPAMIR